MVILATASLIVAILNHLDNIIYLPGQPGGRACHPF